VVLLNNVVLCWNTTWSGHSGNCNFT